MGGMGWGVMAMGGDVEVWGSLMGLDLSGGGRGLQCLDDVLLS